MNQDKSKPTALPLFASPVQAGFSTPVQDEFESKLDLNEHLIHHPAATFFVRVNGNSMEGANLYPGDILIVDRALEPTHDKIIIARIGSEFNVKRLYIQGEKIQLLSEHPDYPPIIIDNPEDFEVWGVVTYIIHKAR